MPKTWIMTVALCVANVCCFAQGKDVEESHGTVNILLANKNGLALVTDSRLSNKGQPSGEARKLFVLNDHMVCSIADFYSNSGPRAEGGAAPADTNVPGIIATFLERYDRGKPSTPVKDASLTLDQLVGLYSFALQTLATLNVMDHPYAKPQGAELTIAGYANGHLQVSQTKLSPIEGGAAWQYREIGRKDEVVQDDLVVRLAGMTDVAEGALGKPTIKYAPDNPKLRSFRLQLVKNGGRNLSLEQLKNAAVEMEEMTSRAYPSVVGGETQYVTLAGGRITSQHLKVATQPAVNGSTGGIRLEGFTIVLPKGASGSATSSQPSRDLLSYISLDMGVDGGHESLDGKAYVRSTFRNTVLQYSAEGPAFFDQHNVVENSTLEVKRTVPETDTFLLQIKANFPELRVVRVP